MAKIKAKARWIENIRLVVDNARSHSIVCDVPQASGGDDTGPTALELALMSLVGCAATIYADVAKKSGIALSKLEVNAEAEKLPDSPKLASVDVKVYVEAKARKELLEAMWRKTEANCPVLFIFKEPIPIKTELETKQTS